MRGEWKAGKLQLSWAAADGEVYGYDLFRKLSGENEFKRLSALPARLTRFFDAEATSGLEASYFVKAYNLAGRRSAASEVVSIES